MLTENHCFVCGTEHHNKEYATLCINSHFSEPLREILIVARRERNNESTSLMQQACWTRVMVCLYQHILIDNKDGIKKL